MEFSTNVRKNAGRPRVLSEEDYERVGQAIDPEKSYRALYTFMRACRVAGTLIKDSGEVPMQAIRGRTGNRPNSAKRFPWLLGNRIQYTVLAELHGTPEWLIIQAARHIERAAAKDGMNAKRARDYARDLKVILSV